jgi:hypothetical protein
MRFISSLFSVPELEKYSEKEFEHLVWQAKLRRGDALWVLPFGAGMVGAAAWVGVWVLLTMGIKALGTPLTGTLLQGWGAANLLVCLLVWAAIAMTVRWMLIVRSVRRIINKAGCPFCEFSLVGLRVQHGWVRCPECGQRVYLHEHRLTEDDLILDKDRYRPLPGAGPTGAFRPRSSRDARARR